MSMKTAFEIGVVLTVKDAFSSACAKAQQDLRLLSKTSPEAAAAFERNLNKWQRLTEMAATASAISYAVASVYEDTVRTAGNAETAIDRVMISQGDHAQVSREEVEKNFHALKGQWGMADTEISTAVREMGGKFGDWSQALLGTGVAAELATAKHITLGEAVHTLTSIEEQFGNQQDKSLSAQERIGQRAGQLARLIGHLGGRFEFVDAVLRTAGPVAEGAGVKFETLAAAMELMGKRGVDSMRGGLALTTLMEKMPAILHSPAVGTIAPAFAKSHNLIDLLSDLHNWFGRLHTSESEQVRMLDETFGASMGAKVKMLMDNVDDLSKAQADYGDTTENAAAMQRGANSEMETYEGRVKRLNEKFAEFKEVVGGKGVAAVKSLSSVLGGMLDKFTSDPTWKAIFGTGGLLLGGAAEAGKLALPVVALLGYLKANSIANSIKAALANSATGTMTVQAGVVNVGGATPGVPNALATGAGGAGTGAGAVTVAAVAMPVLAVVAAILAGFLSQADQDRKLKFYREWLLKGGVFSDQQQQEMAALDYLNKGSLSTGETASAFQIAVNSDNLIKGTTSAQSQTMPGVKSGEPTPVQYAQGGPVDRTGMALVHEGEFVVPKRGAGVESRSGGGVHIDSISVTVQGGVMSESDADRLVGRIWSAMSRRAAREGLRYG